MHSFSAISLITLGLAAFAFASPVVPPVQIRDTNVTAIAALTNIVTNLNSEIGPLAAELQYIEAENATLVILTPILDDVKQIIGAAIVAVNATSELNTVIDTASINALATILAALLSTIFTALAAVLKSVSADESDTIFSLLSDVGGLVGQLLGLILPLVTGLVGALLPLIGNIFGTILRFNVTSIISIIGPLALELL